MRLVSFFRLGEATFGLEKRGGIVDLGERFKNRSEERRVG